MTHSLMKALRLVLAITVVASLFVACGSGHKCEKTSDCKTGEACQTNATTKLRECVASAATCTPACAADEECKAGKCEKKPTGTCTPACPTGQTCDNGTCKPPVGGCNPACNADQVCDNGTCKAKDTGCKSDADCTGTNETCEVATGKCIQKSTGCNPACTADQVCENGACKPKPAGCKGDSDCSGATPKCNVGTGLCVECIATADCTGGKTCTDNKCGGGTGCNSDADCNNGQKCVGAPNGKCEAPPGIKTAGQACSQTEGCVTGLRCIGVSATESFCVQDCTADADCTDTFRNKCVALQASDGSPLNFCLRLSAKGEACGFGSDKGEQGICSTPTGATPLYCDTAKKTCEEVTLQKNEGDPCNKSTDTTQPPKRCDTASGIACDEATGTCKKAKIANEGEECDADGRNNAGEIILCATGMLCIGFDSNRTLQRCHVPCKSVSAGGDSSECKVAGTKCEDLLSGANPGLCFDNQCTTDTECAFPNNRCADAQGGGKICLPKQPNGPVKFGGLCKNPVKTFGCDSSTDPDIFCLSATEQSTQGFCSRNCSQDDKCPSWTDGTNTIAATCVAAGANGTKFCLFDCGQPGQTCPTGLTCQAISGGMTCLAP